MLEEQIEKQQEQLLRYSEAYEKSEGYGEVLKERKRNLESNREQLMLTLGSVGERSADRQREVADLELKLEQSRLKLADLRKQL